MADKTNSNQRFIRKTVILAAIEATYGTAPTFTPATDALLISDVEMTYTSNNQERDVIRAYLGASEELVGDDYVTFTFSVELAPSGTVATAPAWGKLLRACGMAETVVATKSVYYTPVSTGFSSLAFMYYLDGVAYQATGGRGSFELSMGIGETPKIKFTFMARYNQASPSAVANPGGITYAAFKAPLVVTSYNSGMVKLGAAYNKATNALTGGDTYASRGFSFNMANNTVYQPMLGIDRVLITDRKPAGSITLDLAAADEVAFRTDVRTNTLRSLTFDHGTTAGAKVLVHTPAAQLTNPKVVDQDGVAMTSFDVRYVPTSGDDEVFIVCQ